LTQLIQRLRALMRRRRLDQDLDDELAFHLDMRAGQIERSRYASPHAKSHARQA
jgi:hypothetical protein